MRTYAAYTFPMAARVCFLGMVLLRSPPLKENWVGVHFFNGEGVANDVLREPLKISSLLWMDAETGVLPDKERSGDNRPSSTRKVMVRARNSSSTINVLLEDIELELEILQK